MLFFFFISKNMDSWIIILMFPHTNLLQCTLKESDMDTLEENWSKLV